MSHSARERIVACPRHAMARDGLDAGSCRFRQIATSEFASFPLVNRGRAAYRSISTTRTDFVSTRSVLFEILSIPRCEIRRPPSCCIGEIFNRSENTCTATRRCIYRKRMYVIDVLCEYFFWNMRLVITRVRAKVYAKVVVDEKI